MDENREVKTNTLKISTNYTIRLKFLRGKGVAIISYKTRQGIQEGFQVMLINIFQNAQ